MNITQNSALSPNFGLDLMVLDLVVLEVDLKSS